jgi:hypothetical protein
MANLTVSKGISTSIQYWEPQILSGSTTSDGIPISGKSVVGFIFPTMDGSNMTVNVSLDGTNWKTLNGVTLSIVDGKAYNVDIQTMSSWKFVRFISDTSETSNRTLTVLTKLA